MTTKGTTWPTLLDVAKRLDPDGRIPYIAEIMNLVNPFLDDIPFTEGNLSTGHVGIIRTGLPTVAWRQLNAGTQPSKSTTKKITDSVGMAEAFSRLDEEVYKLNGSSDAFRASEDKTFIEAMSQLMATTVLYGNTEANPERFLGLHPRYSSLSAESGGQIVDAGGTGSDNTSLWLCTWDPRIMHGIYPKGSMAGITAENLGRQVYQNASDNTIMMVLLSHFMFKAGIHLKDWAGNSRIANVDVSNLADITSYSGKGSAGPLLIDYMLDAIGKIPNRLSGVGRRVFYCNKTVHTALNKLMLYQTIHQLTPDKLENGTPIIRFQGIPIRVCDSIVNTEARIT